MTSTKRLCAALFILAALVLVTIRLNVPAVVKNLFDDNSTKLTASALLPSSVVHSTDVERNDTKQLSRNQEGKISSTDNTLLAKLTRLAKAAFSPTATPEMEIKLHNFIERAIIESPTDLLSVLSGLDKSICSFEQKTKIYVSAMAAWANADFAKLSHWIESNNQTGKLDSALSNLAHTAKTAPLTSLKLAEHIHDLHEQELAIQFVIRNWVTQDAKSAAHWAVSNAKAFHLYAEDIFAQVIDVDIHSAIGALASFDTETLTVSGRIIDLLGAKINEEPTSQAVIYDSTMAILALPQGDFQDEVVHAIFPSILNSLTITDTKSLLSEMPAGENKKSLNLLVVNRLAMNDTYQALEFTESIEDHPTKLEATESVVNHWAKHDLKSASEWLKSNKQVSKKSAHVMVKAALRKKDIHIAKTWISRLNKNESAEELHMKMIHLLNETDKNQALDYLDKNSGFTQQEKEAVLGYLSQR